MGFLRYVALDILAETMPYWISRDSQQYGPYSLEMLRRLVAEGKFGSTDWMWEEGTAQWIPLCSYTNASSPSFNSATGRAYRPVPPDLHWALVFLFGILTLGIFTFVWQMVIASFVRKLNSDESPRYLILAGFACIHFASLVRIISAHHSGGKSYGGMYTVLVMAGTVCYLVARFRIRQHLVTYYNFVEPVGLYLSGALTFFFGSYYIQYHLSRIAQWKQTGYLKPQ